MMQIEVAPGVKMRVFTVATLLLLAVAAEGGPIVNGGFETTTGNTSSFLMGSGTEPYAPDNWTFSTGLGCVVFPASTTSQTNACGASFASLYPGWTLSSGGGNFVAVDGDPSYSGSLSQTISVISGKTYVVTFEQAASQFQFYSGVTTEQWQVSLDSDIKLSDLMNNSSHGFVPWASQSLTFTATTTGTAVLRFLAIGSGATPLAPSGLPPVVLLDSVSITESPEPATLLFTGAGLISAFAIRKYARKSR